MYPDPNREPERLFLLEQSNIQTLVERTGQNEKAQELRDYEKAQTGTFAELRLK